MFKVIVDGPLRLRNLEGTDVTPRGKKTRGLLALLAFSKEFRRSRSWLQDKLWSDRGQEQAASSLRQSLSELRKCLDMRADELLTENGCVQLNPDAFVVNTDEITDPESVLEDLDIRDAEFENWLRDLRAGFGGISRPQPTRQKARACRPTVVFGIHHLADDPLGLMAMLKADTVRSLLEVGGVNVVELDQPGSPATSIDGPGLFVRLNALNIADAASVRASIETLSGSYTIWQSTIVSVRQDQTIDDETVWRVRAISQALVARIMEEGISLAQVDGQMPLAMALICPGGPMCAAPRTLNI